MAIWPNRPVRGVPRHAEIQARTSIQITKPSPREGGGLSRLRSPHKGKGAPGLPDAPETFSPVKGNYSFFIASAASAAAPAAASAASEAEAAASPAASEAAAAASPAASEAAAAASAAASTASEAASVASVAAVSSDFEQAERARAPTTAAARTILRMYGNPLNSEWTKHGTRPGRKPTEAVDFARQIIA